MAARNNINSDIQTFTQLIFCVKVFRFIFFENKKSLYINDLNTYGADEGNRIPVTALARPYSNH